MLSRRYRYRTSRIPRTLKPTKYSNETFAALHTFDLSQAATQVAIIVTPASSVGGTRKCKNFTLSIVSSSVSPMFFALVYNPEGTDPSMINAGTTAGDIPYILSAASLYEPNQNVIMSGLLGGPNSTVERFRSRLARNLNSGDRIVLLLRTIEAAQNNVQISVALNYAIAY